ncbi:MAG: molybdate ABC transporter permease subunit [Gammaproteobacteria bacterium]|nr:molybdate ABC transporter permease subunit [Gammaproteobacteria bacterium]
MFEDLPFRFSGLGPLLLSIKLGAVTTLLLLLVGTPLALWLARTRSRLRVPIEAMVALPLVLPPTVLGFYLLVLLGPAGAIGSWWLELTDSALVFSFGGLVIASMVYSLPFVVQPIQNAFEASGTRLQEAAATLGAGRFDIFFTVTVPLAARGFLTALIMGFAHTLGEFGVVLMVGGNIPGETRVISIAIYDHVESLNYEAAHITSAILVAFSFVVMLTLYTINRRWRHE